MRVVGIVGSLRPSGNTEHLVKRVLDGLSGEGLETELISLKDKTILPCKGCMGCRKTGSCAQEIDDFAEVFAKMVAADGIIVGSPTYVGSAAPPLMALLDRATYVGRATGTNLLAGKVGAPVAVARRAGHTFTFAQLLLWYFINDMIIPGSSYWNVALAGAGGARDAEKDLEAAATLDHFAQNMAEVLQRMRG